MCVLKGCLKTGGGGFCEIIMNMMYFVIVFITIIYNPTIVIPNF